MRVINFLFIALLILYWADLAAEEAASASRLDIAPDVVVEQPDERSRAELASALHQALDSATRELNGVELQRLGKPIASGQLRLSYSGKVLLRNNTVEADQIALLVQQGEAYVLTALSDQNVVHAYQGISLAAIRKLVCRNDLRIEHPAQWCSVVDEPFLQEAAIADQISAACGSLEEGSPPRTRCVESVLHHLWEERRVLYTEYDKVLKRAWTRSLAYCEHKECPSDWVSNRDQPAHRLFDKFLEQTKLERELGALFAQRTSLEFKRVAAAISGDGSASPDAHITEEVERIERSSDRLRTLLRDLLRANPDLPPSVHLTLPVFDRAPPPGNFQTIGEQIGTEPAVPNLQHTGEPAATQSIGQFMKDERARRERLLKLSDELNALKKGNAALYLSLQKADLSLEQRKHLQEEITANNARIMEVTLTLQQSELNLDPD